MIRRAVIVVMLVWLAAAGALSARVEYTLTVRADDPLIQVQARIHDITGPTVTVALPVWAPGYYRRLDPYRNVSGMAITRDGAALDITQPSPSLWCVDNTPGQTITVDYTVRANEDDTSLGMMTAYVGKNTAFVHPGSVCVYVDGQTTAPSTVTLRLPEGWDVATPLPRNASGTYEAPDYDTLNDSPVRMGAFKRIPFRLRSREFEIITVGDCRVPDATLLDTCRRIAGSTIDLFGGYVPFQRYQFHFQFPAKRATQGPGLEHRNSTVIAFSSRENSRTFHQRAASFISHEFIHAWNVKALRPEGLGPFDYQAQPETPSLWLAEGLTSYYEAIVLVRAGIWTPDTALRFWEHTANDYWKSNGRNTTSLSESSTTVWSNGWSSGGGGTNYYQKGAMAGWLLDVNIRSATKNQHSLDDAMRWIMTRYAEKNIPYPPDALLTGIRESTGTDVSDLYRRLVHGKEDLPFVEILAHAGVQVESVEEAVLTLGLDFDSADKEPVVRGVWKGSAAEKAQIQVGDVLLQIDGERVGPVTQPLLGGKKRRPGDSVEIVVRRDGTETPLTVRLLSECTIRFRLRTDASPEQKAVWDALWASDRFVRST